MSAALLELDKVGRSFGGVRAVHDVSLKIQEGEIVGLIGPNGAGKTTLINAITGVHPPTAGRVFYRGSEIGHKKPHHIAALGLARTFQVVQPFPDMTVLENVIAGSLFAGGSASMSDARDAAREQLELTGLAPLADRPASKLTLANRKRLELAKSLAMRPKLLLLDEVNAGLNSSEVNQALELIGKIRERGITILIIEHLLKVVLTLCPRIVVLHHGELIADDAANDVVRDPKVIEAYLGSKFAERYGARHG
jgi:branched-chain amino acid transport system ATP-binding protein